MSQERTRALRPLSLSLSLFFPEPVTMFLLWLLVSVSLRPAHGYTNPTDFPADSFSSVCTCQPPPMPFTLSFHGNAQTSARPFDVTTSAATYQPGDTITVTISATSPVEFIGFHMHACEEGSNRIIGTFSLVSGGSGFLQCPGLTNAAVIQNTNVARSSVSHNWIAPLSPSLGNIVFRTTFVQNFPTFWLDANSTRITRQVATMATTTVPTTTSTIIPTIITATANHASASSTANRTTTTTATTTASTNTTTTAAPPIIAPTFIATAATTTNTATPTPTTTTATPTTTPTTTASPITATSTLTTTTTTNTESTTAPDISSLDFSFSSAEAGCCSPESSNCSFFRITNQSTGITAMLSAPISTRPNACLVIVTSVLDSAMLNESLLVYNVTNKTQRTLYNGTTFINKNVVEGIELHGNLTPTNVLKINATVNMSVLAQNMDFVKQVNNSTGVSLSLAEGSMFNGECSGPLAITPLTRCTASGALLSHARAVSTGSPIAQLLFFTLTSLFIARSP